MTDVLLSDLISNAISGATGYTGSAGQGFNFRGEWNAETTYVTNDVVTFDGESFIPNTTNNVTTVSGWQPYYGYYWSKIAAKGNVGFVGSQGAIGYTGSAGNKNVDGGNATSTYLPTQLLNGGSANG